MTGPDGDPGGSDRAAADGAGGPVRTTGDRVARATVRTAHADPDAVAAALRPDNTDEMDTAVEAIDGDDGSDGTDDGDAGASDGAGDDDPDGSGDDRRVRTTVERGSAAGLRSTVDDYLVNVDVADRTYRHAIDRTKSP